MEFYLGGAETLERDEDSWAHEMADVPEYDEIDAERGEDIAAALAEVDDAPCRQYMLLSVCSEGATFECSRCNAKIDVRTGDTVRCYVCGVPGSTEAADALIRASRERAFGALVQSNAAAVLAKARYVTSFGSTITPQACGYMQALIDVLTRNEEPRPPVIRDGGAGELIGKLEAALMDSASSVAEIDF